MANILEMLELGYADLLPRIEFRVCDSDEIIWEGAGRFWRDGSKLLLQAACNGNPWEELELVVNRTAGKLLGDSDFFDITGITSSGTQFRVKQIVRSFGGDMATQTLSITTEVPELLVGKSKMPEDLANSCTVTFSQSLAAMRFFPKSKQVDGYDSSEPLCFRRRAGDYVFVFRQKKIGFGIKVFRRGCQCIDRGIADDLADVLGFVAGIAWSWETHRLEMGFHTDPTLIRFGERVATPVAWHPIYWRGETDPDSFFRLFESIMEKLLTNEQELRLLLSHARNIIQTRTRSIEERILVASAAIEAAAQFVSELRGISGPSKKELDDVVAKLGSIGLDSRMANRLCGFAASLGKASTKDVLHELESAGTIPHGRLAAWQTVRHKIAHGGDVPAGDEVRFIYAAETCRVLFSELLLVAAGYQGPYTDYSKLSYPTSQMSTGKIIPPNQAPP